MTTISDVTLVRFVPWTFLTEEERVPYEGMNDGTPYFVRYGGLALTMQEFYCHDMWDFLEFTKELQETLREQGWTHVRPPNRFEKGVCMRQLESLVWLVGQF